MVKAAVRHGGWPHREGVSKAGHGAPPGRRGAPWCRSGQPPRVPSSPAERTLPSVQGSGWGPAEGWKGPLPLRQARRSGQEGARTGEPGAKPPASGTLREPLGEQRKGNPVGSRRATLPPRTNPFTGIFR